MSATVAFLRAARVDALDARAWYDGQSEGLGDEFTAALQAALERIADDPRRFPKARPGIRKATLKRFPYSVFFEDGEKDILVIAVFHASRDPKVWRDRTRP